MTGARAAYFPLLIWAARGMEIRRGGGDVMRRCLMKHSRTPDGQHFTACPHLATWGGLCGFDLPPLPPRNLGGIISPTYQGTQRNQNFLGAQGKLVLWTKSSQPAHVGKKIKKRHHWRLITHADVSSFNAAAKHISQADRLQKMGVQNMKCQLIYSM